MNKLTVSKESGLVVGESAWALWKYDSVSQTIFWLGSGKYLGKLVPDTTAVGLNSDLCRIAGIPCDAVQLTTGEIVYDTECFIFPSSFWQTAGAEVARVVPVTTQKVRETYKEQRLPVASRPIGANGAKHAERMQTSSEETV